MGNLQVRFLEGWAPAMAPGHSTVGKYGPAFYSASLGNSWLVGLLDKFLWRF
jgi:hypothetical protein